MKSTLLTTLSDKKHFRQSSFTGSLSRHLSFQIEGNNKKQRSHSFDPYAESVTVPKGKDTTSPVMNLRINIPNSSSTRPERRTGRNHSRFSVLGYVTKCLELVSADMIKFYLLCILWYSSSAITNNIGKEIMNQYRHPVTLTFVQFGFVAFFCGIYAYVLRLGKLRYPTSAVLSQTFPLSMFQVFGHIFSSIAILYVPVSFAHTIKALSPFFTVIIYRIFYQVLYSSRIYMSLIPLTVGVMLVVATGLKFHFIGCLSALASTLVFVIQNIVSKKLFTHADAKSHPGPIKLDKLNLLFYSSGMAFILMFPIWIYSDGLGFLRTPKDLPSNHLTTLFFLNGVSHFAQNVLAFWILSLISPITYSIASLVKRIFVITASIIYFGDAVSFVQGFGICLTFFGLWLYNDAKRDVAASEAHLHAGGNGGYVRASSGILPLAQSHPH